MAECGSGKQGLSGFDLPSRTAEPAPESPCIRHCTLDERDECVGCGRMIDEIMGWSAAPTSRKIEICAAAAARLEKRRLRRIAAWR